MTSSYSSSRSGRRGAGGSRHAERDILRPRRIVNGRLTIEALPSPAGDLSSAPQLTTAGDRSILSWMERAVPRSLFKFAERTPTGWSDAKTIASGNDLVVNAADVPSVRALADGTLAAAWMLANSPDPEAYDLRLAWSKDGGATWSKPVSPHHDRTETQHGFASLFQAPGAGLGLVWLDGRATNPKLAHPTDNMSLRAAVFGRAGAQLSEIAIDTRVCDCCPTVGRDHRRRSDRRVSQSERQGDPRHLCLAPRGRTLDAAGRRAQRRVGNRGVPGQRSGDQRPRTRRRRRLVHGIEGRRQGLRRVLARRAAARSASRCAWTTSRRSVTWASSCSRTDRPPCRGLNSPTSSSSSRFAAWRQTAHGPPRVTIAGGGRSARRRPSASHSGSRRVALRLDRDGQRRVACSNGSCHSAVAAPCETGSGRGATDPSSAAESGACNQS